VQELLGTNIQDATLAEPRRNLREAVALVFGVASRVIACFTANLAFGIEQSG
jgi:hypothetical protein